MHGGCTGNQDQLLLEEGRKKRWSLLGSWNKITDVLQRGLIRSQFRWDWSRHFKPSGTKALYGGLLWQSIGTCYLILKNCAILYNTEILKYLKAFSIGCSSDWLWCIFQQFFLKMLIRGSRNEVFCVLYIDSRYLILIPKYLIQKTAKKQSSKCLCFAVCCICSMVTKNTKEIDDAAFLSPSLTS